MAAVGKVLFSCGFVFVRSVWRLVQVSRMPLVESYNGSMDLFLVSCISLSYAAGRVLQQFNEFVSSFVNQLSFKFKSLFMV